MTAAVKQRRVRELTTDRFRAIVTFTPDQDTLARVDITALAYHEELTGWQCLGARIRLNTPQTTIAEWEPSSRTILVNNEPIAQVPEDVATWIGMYVRWIATTAYQLATTPLPGKDLITEGRVLRPSMPGRSSQSSPAPEKPSSFAARKRRPLRGPTKAKTFSKKTSGSGRTQRWKGHRGRWARINNRKKNPFSLKCSQPAQ